MRVRHLGSAALAAALVASVACGSSGGPGTSAPPAPSAEPTAAPPTAPANTAGGAPTRIDINAIFPPGPGRDLALNNCQNCHTFVPLVILQMDEAAWTRNSVDHRPRVTGLSDDDFKTLYDYLKANFNPSRPVPTLPQELLDTWTGY